MTSGVNLQRRTSATATANPVMPGPQQLEEVTIAKHLGVTLLGISKAAVLGPKCGAGSRR